MTTLRNNHNFRWLVLGQGITVFGSRILSLAFSLTILDITGRADLFALFTSVIAATNLLSPIGGAISDRYDRKLIMVGNDAIHGLLALLFALVLYQFNSVLSIGIIMVIFGALNSIEGPNGAAILVDLVPKEKLESCRGILEGIQNISMILGPILGGVFYMMMGVQMLALFGGIFFLLATVMECFIRFPKRIIHSQKGAIKGIISDLKDGFAFIKANPLIYKTVLFAAFLNFAVTPGMDVAFPVIARITLHANDFFYGLGMAFFSIGMAAGALLTGKFSEKIKFNDLYKCFLFSAGFSLISSLALFPAALALGFYPSYLWFFISNLPMAAAFAVANVIFLARVQKNIPSSMQGKVLGAIFAISQCMKPFGQALFGVLCEWSKSAMYIPIISTSAALVVAALGMKRLLSGQNTTELDLKIDNPAVN
ncbi:MAG: MFS transporter [Erysipelotrichaceae bacterium]|jgi:MFS family permease|nr:MFS transporter [Erysipelotrichaceae bacterium]